MRYRFAIFHYKTERNGKMKVFIETEIGEEWKRKKLPEFWIIYHLYNQSSFDIHLIDRCGFVLKTATCHKRRLKKKQKEKTRKKFWFFDPASSNNFVHKTLNMFCAVCNTHHLWRWNSFPPRRLFTWHICLSISALINMNYVHESSSGGL